MSDGVDVVVRFHDPARLRELDGCLFSLIGQTYRPLRICLSLQRFSAAAVAAVTAAVAPLLEIDPAVELKLLNWQRAEPADARSCLLNQGIAAASGRYLAFLDYDDVLYPEAYELLAGRLQATEAAVAFAGLCAKYVAAQQAFVYAERKGFPFQGRTLFDELATNFCPIHSFMIDRSRVSSQLLYFDPGLTRGEDYEFLIRLCATYPSDFALISRYVGEYRFKDDGSNTILAPGDATERYRRASLEIEAFLEQRRRTLAVSEAVQRQAGMAYQPGLTVREFLNRARGRR